MCCFGLPSVQCNNCFRVPYGQQQPRSPHSHCGPHACTYPAPLRHRTSLSRIREHDMQASPYHLRMPLNRTRRVLQHTTPPQRTPTRAEWCRNTALAPDDTTNTFPALWQLCLHRHSHTNNSFRTMMLLVRGWNAIDTVPVEWSSIQPRSPYARHHRHALGTPQKAAADINDTQHMHKCAAFDSRF